MNIKTINSRVMPFGKYEGEKIINLETTYLTHCLENFVMPTKYVKTMRIILIWRLGLHEIFEEYKKSDLKPLKKGGQNG